jgi:hypothetical protein
MMPETLQQDCDADLVKRDQLEPGLQQRVHESADAEQRMRSVVDHVVDGIITSESSNAMAAECGPMQNSTKVRPFLSR